MVRRDRDSSREPTEATSEELARRAQLGDQRALGHLVARHQNEAYRVALRMAGDPFDAEEIIQTAFERVLRSLSRYDPDRPFRPWFMRVMVNQARTHLKKRRLKAILFGQERDAPAPAAGEPEQRRLQKATRELLAKAIATLPVNQREVFVLKHIEGYAYEEIAVITGGSVGNLKVRAHRARRALLTWFKEHNVTWREDAR